MNGRLGIKTRVRIAKYTKLNEAIPSFIYAGWYQVRTAYRNQPCTCRNCQKGGHNAKDCTARKVCRICGEPGHTKGSCPQRCCYYSHEQGHETATCDKYVEDYPSLLTKESDTSPTEIPHSPRACQRHPSQQQRPHPGSRSSRRGTANIRASTQQYNSGCQRDGYHAGK
jgi:hypothetical protein